MNPELEEMNKVKCKIDKRVKDKLVGSPRKNGGG